MESEILKLLRGVLANLRAGGAETDSAPVQENSVPARWQFTDEEKGLVVPKRWQFTDEEMAIIRPSRREQVQQRQLTETAQYPPVDNGVGPTPQEVAGWGWPPTDGLGRRWEYGVNVSWPDPVQQILLFPVYEDEQIAEILDPVDGEAFRDIVGQEEAKNRLKRAAWNSWKRVDHLFTTNLLLEGPTSTGKTTLVRKFVKIGLDLPLCEINGANVKQVKEICQAIAVTLREFDREHGHGGPGEGLALVRQGADKKVLPPPMIVFIDEAHRLPPGLQEALLKAVDPSDRQLFAATGPTMDCSRVGFILGTLNPGDLIEALRDQCQRIPVD